MATRIFSGVLRALESIYTFPNSQKSAPGEMELDLPIQPVHDVGPLAKVGSALGPFGGWWLASDIHSHVALGTLSTNLSPYKPSATFDPFPDEVDPNKYLAWLYGSGLYTNNSAAFDKGRVYYRPSTHLLGPVRSFLSSQGGFDLGYWDVAVTANTPCRLDGATANQLIFPMPLPQDFAAYIYFTSTSQGAGVVDLTWNGWLWYGTLGTGGPIL